MRKQILAAAALALTGTTAALADAPATPPAPSIALIQPIGHARIADPTAAAEAKPAAPAADAPIVVIGDCCEPCVPRLWAQAGYTFFFLSPQPVPAPLATTSTPPSLGILGQAGTLPLISGDVDYGTFAGGKVYSGMWLNECRTFGTDGSFIWLEEKPRSYSVTSDGSTVISRPIVNANTGGEAAALVAFPGVQSGSLTAQNHVRFFTSDGNLLFNVRRNDKMEINALVGFRYLYFWEQLNIVQNATALAPGFMSFLGNRLPAGSQLVIQDRFETANFMYMGQLGLRGESVYGKVHIGLAGKVGLGWANQRLFVDGRTTEVATATTVPGGVLAQATIPYRTYHDTFVVAPEVTGKIGYQITERLEVYGDYTMLYVSSVARPGMQVDRSINPTLPPSFQTFGPPTGVLAPNVQKNVSDLFAHGISVGLGYRY